MKVLVFSIFDATPEECFERVKSPHFLDVITKPLLKFEKVKPAMFSVGWEVGQVYELKLWVLGIIPIGNHWLQVTKLDEGALMLVTRERGTLISKWDHIIRLRNAGDSKAIYEDEVHIEAGKLTLPIWFFAHMFFRYRQFKWKIELKRAKKIVDK